MLTRMTLKRLSDLKHADFRSFLNSFDYILTDCDGVLWRGEPLAGSGDFINAMKGMGKKVFFISNNSMRTEEQYQEKFKSCGIDAKPEEVMYPSKAIVSYLKSINFNKKIFTSTCAQAKKTLEANGYECKVGPEVTEDYPFTTEKYMTDDPEIGAVVLDSDFTVNWAKISLAATYLRRPDVLYLVGATDKFVPLRKHFNAVGPGFFNDIVSQVSGREPMVLAKPSVQLVHLVQKIIGYQDPRRVLFIGDIFHAEKHKETREEIVVMFQNIALKECISRYVRRNQEVHYSEPLAAVYHTEAVTAKAKDWVLEVEQDIGFGKAGGFQTLLVLSSFTLEDLDQFKGKNMDPDFITDSLGDIVPQFANGTTNGST